VLSRPPKLTDVLTTLLLSTSDPYVRDNIQETSYYLRGTDESLDSGSTYSFAASQSTSYGNRAQTPSSHAGRYYHLSNNYLSPQPINMNHYGRFSTSSPSSSSSTQLSEASYGYFTEYSSDSLSYFSGGRHSQPGRRLSCRVRTLRSGASQLTCQTSLTSTTAP